MIGVGVIGYGYWGPNLVRNFMDFPGFKLVGVSDLRKERLAQVETRHPGVKVTTDYTELLADPSIDAVAIATPVSSHFDMALKTLHAGKHLLVEKPLTAMAEQGERLVEEADRCKKVLMVDHTFIYTSAVRKIRELLETGSLGEIYYYDSVRVNLGLFQHDVNVLWDLAVHDLSIMDYVLNAKPSAVAAIGTSHVPGQPKDIAYLTCFFDGNLIGHIHVNWLAPVKVRRTLIGGARQMIVYDELEPSEKVKVYDKGITLNNATEGRYQLLVGYRTGDMWAPQLNGGEALRAEIQHFHECIEQGAQPITDGRFGLRLVRILEAANHSLAGRGRPIELHWDGDWT